MEFREFSAKTVDEAITKASIEFETSSENLEIQVISQGKAGFLGFGAKPAIIRAGKKEEEEILPEDVKEAKEPAHPEPSQYFLSLVLFSALSYGLFSVLFSLLFWLEQIFSPVLLLL